MDTHRDALLKFCRICGSCDRSIDHLPSRKTDSEFVSSCIKFLNVDESIQNFKDEDPDIFPNYICYICYRKLTYFNNNLKLGKNIKKIDVAYFEKHLENCNICLKEPTKKVGSLKSAILKSEFSEDESTASDHGTCTIANSSESNNVYIDKEQFLGNKSNSSIKTSCIKTIDSEIIPHPNSAIEIVKNSHNSTSTVVEDDNLKCFDHPTWPLNKLKVLKTVEINELKCISSNVGIEVIPNDIKAMNYEGACLEINIPLANQDDALVSQPNNSCLRVSTEESNSLKLIDSNETNITMSENDSLELIDGNNTEENEDSLSYEQHNSRSNLSHEERLIYFCRLCGQIKIGITESSIGILKTSFNVQKHIKKILEVNVFDEPASIYPPAVCLECCDMLKSNFVSLSANRKLNNLNLEIVAFEPHKDKFCSICTVSLPKFYSSESSIFEEKGGKFLPVSPKELYLNALKLEAESLWSKNVIGNHSIEQYSNNNKKYFPKLSNKKILKPKNIEIFKNSNNNSNKKLKKISDSIFNPKEKTSHSSSGEKASFYSRSIEKYSNNFRWKQTQLSPKKSLTVKKNSKNINVNESNTAHHKGKLLYSSVLIRNSSASLEDNKQHSVSLEDNKQNSVSLENSKQNSVSLEDSKQNSVSLEGSKQNSVSLEDSKQNSVSLEDSKQNSVSSEVNKQNSVSSEVNKQNYVSLEDSKQNSVTLEDNKQNSVLSSKHYLETSPFKINMKFKESPSFQEANILWKEERDKAIRIMKNILVKVAEEVGEHFDEATFQDIIYMEELPVPSHKKEDDIKKMIYVMSNILTTLNNVLNGNFLQSNSSTVTPNKLYCQELDNSYVVSSELLSVAPNQCISRVSSEKRNIASLSDNNELVDNCDNHWEAGKEFKMASVKTNNLPGSGTSDDTIQPLVKKLKFDPLQLKSSKLSHANDILFPCESSSALDSVRADLTADLTSIEADVVSFMASSKLQNSNNHLIYTHLPSTAKDLVNNDTNRKFSEDTHKISSFTKDDTINCTLFNDNALTTSNILFSDSYTNEGNISLKSPSNLKYSPVISKTIDDQQEVKNDKITNSELSLENSDSDDEELLCPEVIDKLKGKNERSPDKFHNNSNEISHLTKPVETNNCMINLTSVILGQLPGSVTISIPENKNQPNAIKPLYNPDIISINAVSPKIKELFNNRPVTISPVNKSCQNQITSSIDSLPLFFENVSATTISQEDFKTIKEDATSISCKENLTSKEILKKPVVKRHECPECHKFFRKPCDVRRHSRTHLKEKPYKCQICGKAFTVLKTYQIHQNLHSGNQVLQCNLCSEQFTTSSGLTLHKRSHMMPLNCTYCSGSFYNYKLLDSHMTKWHSAQHSNVDEQITYLSPKNPPENLESLSNEIGHEPLQINRNVSKCDKNILESVSNNEKNNALKGTSKSIQIFDERIALISDKQDSGNDTKRKSITLSGEAVSNLCEIAAAPLEMKTSSSKNLLCEDYANTKMSFNSNSNSYQNETTSNQNNSLELFKDPLVIEKEKYPCKSKSCETTSKKKSKINRAENEKVNVELSLINELPIKDEVIGDFSKDLISKLKTNILKPEYAINTKISQSKYDLRKTKKKNKYENKVIRKSSKFSSPVLDLTNNINLEKSKEKICLDKKIQDSEKLNLEFSVVKNIKKSLAKLGLSQRNSSNVSVQQAHSNFDEVADSTVDKSSFLTNFLDNSTGRASFKVKKLHENNSVEKLENSAYMPSSPITFNKENSNSSNSITQIVLENCDSLSSSSSSSNDFDINYDESSIIVNPDGSFSLAENNSWNSHHSSLKVSVRDQNLTSFKKPTGKLHKNKKKQEKVIFSKSLKSIDKKWKKNNCKGKVTKKISKKTTKKALHKKYKGDLHKKTDLSAIKIDLATMQLRERGIDIEPVFEKNNNSDEIYSELLGMNKTKFKKACVSKMASQKNISDKRKPLCIPKPKFNLNFIKVESNSVGNDRIENREFESIELCQKNKLIINPVEEESNHNCQENSGLFLNKCDAIKKQLENGSSCDLKKFNSELVSHKSSLAAKMDSRTGTNTNYNHKIAATESDKKPDRPNDSCQLKLHLSEQESKTIKAKPFNIRVIGKKTNENLAANFSLDQVKRPQESPHQLNTSGEKILNKKIKLEVIHPKNTFKNEPYTVTPNVNTKTNSCVSAMKVESIQHNSIVIAEENIMNEFEKNYLEISDPVVEEEDDAIVISWVD